MFIANKPRIAFRSPRKSLIKIKVLDENIFQRNHILMPLLLEHTETKKVSTVKNYHSFATFP